MWRTRKTKLTKAEKETIVLYNELEDTAHISTYDAGLRKRLASFAEKHPELCRQNAAYDQGGASFIIVKSRLSIRLEPPYSEERRQLASEMGKLNAQNLLPGK